MRVTAVAGGMASDMPRESQTRIIRVKGGGTIGEMAGLGNCAGGITSSGPVTVSWARFAVTGISSHSRERLLLSDGLPSFSLR